jgi:hypothetical protein
MRGRWRCQGRPAPTSEKECFVFENPVSRRNQGNQLITPVMPQSSPGISSGRNILRSWKQISVYLGLGVRTVQRYEVQFRLPVHRPAAKTRCAVMAFSDELDGWLRNSPTRDALLAIEHCATAARRTGQNRQAAVVPINQPKPQNGKVDFGNNVIAEREPQRSHVVTREA